MNGAPAGASVDGDGERRIESDDSNVVVFVFCRQGVEICGVVESGATACVDGEVSYAERGEVLKKVGALAWLNTVVANGSFDDDTRSEERRVGKECL